ncbi:hypothetical protein [Chitinophaga cymbidii]|uniref:hypothetical protein n=1 Tax=Chitinophaga cymbidii TaxID=1096750 RepID=UPI0011BDA6D5|nr:hypothetical protein [Chitinophaga cymbidii]
MTRCMPPSIDEVRIYFSQKGLSAAEAECFFFFYEKKGWKNKNGASFKKWKHIAYHWIADVFKYEPWRFNKDIH